MVGSAEVATGTGIGNLTFGALQQLICICLFQENSFE